MPQERRRLAGIREIACKFVQHFYSAKWTYTASQQNDDAKIILANAIQHVGQSVRIWLAASDLERDVKAKKRVLRRGTAALHLSSTLSHYRR